MSSGGGGTTTTNNAAQPYAPAEPALNQIISEAGTILWSGANSCRLCSTHTTNFTRLSCTRNYGRSC